MAIIGRRLKGVAVNCITMKGKNILISVSGGETSMYMAHWCKENWSKDNNLIYVFANTGEENEETLLFIEKCSKHFDLDIIWVECVTNEKYRKGVDAKVVTYETASRNGEPFEAMIRKHGIPNMSFKHCSRELKGNTITKYLKDIGFEMDYKAIGIRVDEIDRMTEDKTCLYPLVKLGKTKPHVNIFWREMPFRLTLKGFEDNCKVCWKKTLRKLLTIAKYHPERFDNFLKWEFMFENFVPETQKEGRITPIRFNRQHLSVKDLLEMAKLPFEDAKDDRIVYTINGVQMEFELDISNGCVESCNAFGD